MRTRVTTLALPVLLLAAISTTAAGQSLETGTWTGTVYPPDGEAVSVTFDVRGEGSDLVITMQDTPMGALELIDIELSESTLEFAWVPGGMLLTCKLERQEDGSYKGPCTDEDGVPGTIVMVPPEGNESAQTPRV